MLTEKSRSSLFQKLSPIAGEEAVSEMLAHFPATSGEQPITKDHLDLRLGELRGELREMRSELQTDIATLRIELHQEVNRLLIWLPGSIAAIGAVIAFVARVSA